ncbi:PREDICTED: uncharacterized protein LOC106808230 [Priapulus caudatus]|uniref:Uncharacterized protein LOC106808230 n=1 Tax=Priapulus caudatus TaxID=37621 RepID=A0ABM1E2C3_PRICU|nr:PREDICTED: uncharacterized protein LOC106808230 [Priapulus caudatus]
MFNGTSTRGQNLKSNPERCVRRKGRTQFNHDIASKNTAASALLIMLNKQREEQVLAEETEECMHNYCKTAPLSTQTQTAPVLNIAPEVGSSGEEIKECITNYEKACLLSTKTQTDPVPNFATEGDFVGELKTCKKARLVSIKTQTDLVPNFASECQRLLTENMELKEQIKKHKAIIKKYRSSVFRGKSKPCMSDC